MDILFVLENYHPHIGGVEHVFKRLCEGLAKEGHRVTVLTHRMKGTAKKESIGGVEVRRVRCLRSRYLFTFAAVLPALRLAKRADLVHTTTYNGAFPAWVAARLRGKPCLITVHETWMGKWREMTDLSLPSAWAHELFEWCVYHIPRFDEYVCVSKATARALGKHLPSRGITTVYNGFDPAPWSKRHPDAKALRGKLGLQKRFVILGYGRPGASKGFEHLIRAFPLIRERIPDATLLLILSRDPQYAHKIMEFEREARKDGGDVRFLPSQPYGMLPAYAQMADCIVVPSLSEGFGYAVVEACASGTPVVASDVASIPEVIYGKHVLVRPGDPRAIAEGVLRVRQGKYSTTTPRKFPWAATLRGYTAVYRRLLA